MEQKILIVDDEPHIRLLLERALLDFEDEGVEILIADNGEAALALIEAEKPALVFLDVMMPKMNGFDVCQKVKRERGLEDIYIVMLTAKGQEFDKQKGEEVGANIYMTKPFDPDEIYAKAEEVLGLERRRK
jgi:two-component system, OmpR family, alkaline phosphatase synthesis response regulator PhoP